MKARMFLSALLLATLSVLADGIVTTPPSVAPTSWKIASVTEITGASATDLAGITIVIYYFDASGRLLTGETQTVSLTTAEIVSFLTTTNAAVAGESGSSVKRRRQRVTKWLVDNGKITNVTPE